MPTSGHDELRIRLDLRPLDLASLATLRTFADGFLEDHDTLDVLIANAGIMACPYGTTVDGFELQWGTNHLGHFLLITRLLPALWKTIPQGAATSVDAATSPDLDGRGGVNLEDCHIAEIAHDPAATDGVSAYALDPAITDALWAYSEQAVAA